MQVQCNECQVALTLEHLATCFALSVDLVYRVNLQNATLAQPGNCHDTLSFRVITLKTGSDPTVEVTSSIPPTVSTLSHSHS